MEDFFWYGQVPLGDFGEVGLSLPSSSLTETERVGWAQIVFTDSSAKTDVGTTVGLTNGTIVNLRLSGSSKVSDA